MDFCKTFLFIFLGLGGWLNHVSWNKNNLVQSTDAVLMSETFSDMSTLSQIISDYSPDASKC